MLWYNKGDEEEIWRQKRQLPIAPADVHAGLGPRDCEKPRCIWEIYCQTLPAAAVSPESQTGEANRRISHACGHKCPY